MKDPKDHKKPEVPPLDSLLSAEYIPTSYGLTCSKMEVLCLQCRKKDLIIVPESYLKLIDGGDSAGSFMAEPVAEQKGWIIKPATRRGGKPAIFMMCPDCIESLFKK
jgi:hypothetical protein